MRVFFIILSTLLLLTGCASPGQEDSEPFFVRINASSSSAEAEPRPASKAKTALDVSLTAEHPIYSPDIQQISFLLENHTDKEITYGLDYYLEYKNGETWEPVSPESDVVPSIGIFVKPRENRAVTIGTSAFQWDWREGDYRLVQPVSLGGVADKLYGTFSIGDSPISASSPYGFVPLEALPVSYSSEQADADGVVCVVHGHVQSNEDKIPIFLQKAEYGLPAMIRISTATIEGDPIYTDIEYHPENNAFRFVYDNSRDRFGVFEGITAKWYPYLHMAERNGSLELCLSEWNPLPKEGSEEFDSLLVCPLSEEKKGEYLYIWNRLKEKYSSESFIQRTLSPSGESSAGIMDRETIAVQIPGKGYLVPVNGKELFYLQWEDEKTLRVWDKQKQYYLYDIEKEEFVGQIAVCEIPIEEN